MSEVKVSHTDHTDKYARGSIFFIIYTVLFFLLSEDTLSYFISGLFMAAIFLWGSHVSVEAEKETRDKVAIIVIDFVYLATLVGINEFGYFLARIFLVIACLSFVFLVWRQKRNDLIIIGCLLVILGILSIVFAWEFDLFIDGHFADPAIAVVFYIFVNLLSIIFVIAVDYVIFIRVDRAVARRLRSFLGLIVFASLGFIFILLKYPLF